MKDVNHDLAGDMGMVDHSSVGIADYLWQNLFVYRSWNSRFLVIVTYLPKRKQQAPSQSLCD